MLRAGWKLLMSHKRYWLLPFVLALLMLAGVVFFSKSPTTTFMYTVF